MHCTGEWLNNLLNSSHFVDSPLSLLMERFRTLRLEKCPEPLRYHLKRSAAGKTEYFVLNVFNRDLLTEDNQELDN